MTYIISDLHGRYDRYSAMLEKIKFSDGDTLYNLGDCIDGPEVSECVKLLKDMMKRKNIINLQGNHELWALPFIRPLKKIDFSAYGILGYRRYPFKNSYARLDDWLNVGGMTTLEGLVNIPRNEAAGIIDYIDSWGFHRDITVCQNRYILSHAGLHEPDTILEKLFYIGAEEWTLSKGLDYRKRYFPEHENIYLVTGHVPTDGKILRKNNHIVVDTGTIFNNPTGCLCLETDEEFYVR